MSADTTSGSLLTQSPGNTPSRSLLIGWGFAVLIGIGLALTRIPSVFVGADVHPLGNDGFYHATRILAIAQDPSSTHAFDSNLHWPDGIWVTWPWAYDYLGGVIVKLFSAGHLDATTVMVFYPLLWLIANITLLGLLAKQLLRPRLAVVAVIAYAAAPLTLSLHALGKMDHHSAEHFWLLLSMYLSGMWLKHPESRRLAIALGVTLAVATAFHNIMFVLQIPILGCLLVARFSGQPLPSIRKTVLFGSSLLITQFLVLLPSHQFTTFEYEFYYHSWFHLHVAFLTTVAALAICSKRNTTMWAVLGVSLILAWPAANQVLFGLRYINSELPMFDLLTETQSPFSRDMSFRGVSYFYSGLVWFLPLCIVYAFYLLNTGRAKAMKLMLMVFAPLGLALLASQVRFYYLGYVFLILIPLLMLQHLLPKGRDVIISSALILAAYTFSISHYLIPPKPGNSQRYSSGLPLINAARLHCQKQPGLLLVDNNWGNFFRYKTHCPLLSNNFIITREEVKFVELTVHLMEQSPENLRIIAPDVRYIMVSSLDDSKLGDDLLSDSVFDGFGMIGEMRGRNGEVFGRLYHVTPILKQ